MTLLRYRESVSPSTNSKYTRISWEDSPWFWLKELRSPSTKGMAGEQLIAAWLEGHGLKAKRQQHDAGFDLLVEDALRLEVKLAFRQAYPPNVDTLRYRPIHDGDFHQLVCIGILPGPSGKHFVWVADKWQVWHDPDADEDELQRRGLVVKPPAKASWAINPEGSLEGALKAIRKGLDAVRRRRS